MSIVDLIKRTLTESTDIEIQVTDPALAVKQVKETWSYS